ncbi:rhodanese-like domain-containing protein [Rhodohalobacter sp. 8-1]|uniref:rhodanese-like domain-containing protein n=1 Tax=Rhodohalobacter sp. 8-1 TaxID=3131972 RepID=UPI0030EF7D7E
MATSCTKSDSSESTAFDSLLQVLLSESVPLITVDELSSIRQEVTILDARAPEEYNVSRIPGSVHAGYDEFNIAAIKHIPKDEQIVVYCSVGYRSEKIGEQLLQAGYRNVKNLHGGIFAWVNQNRLIIDDYGETDRVHPYSLFWRVWITSDKITISRSPRK